MEDFPILNVKIKDPKSLFSFFNALKDSKTSVLLSSFSDAFDYDPKSALKLMFHLGDKSFGLNDSNRFELVLSFVAFTHPYTIKNNIELIPLFGNWDNLIHLLNTPVKSNVIEALHAQLLRDKNSIIDNKPISSLVHSLPQKDETYFKLLLREFEINEKQYLSMLNHLNSKSTTMDIILKSELNSELYDSLDSAFIHKHFKKLNEIDSNFLEWASKKEFSNYLPLLNIDYSNTESLKMLLTNERYSTVIT